jgi:hypothetical protein
MLDFLLEKDRAPKSSFALFLTISREMHDRRANTDDDDGAKNKEFPRSCPIFVTLTFTT